jgi:hypothetical protein
MSLEGSRPGLQERARPRGPIRTDIPKDAYSTNGNRVMTLDQYGHLFGDRLDVVADAMDAAREKALADVEPMWSQRQIVNLADARNSR